MACVLVGPWYESLQVLKKGICGDIDLHLYLFIRASHGLSCYPWETRGGFHKAIYARAQNLHSGSIFSLIYHHVFAP